jgi:hypothetical protein
LVDVWSQAGEEAVDRRSTAAATQEEEELQGVQEEKRQAGKV